MPDTQLIPPACVAAVRTNDFGPDYAEKIARAVLDAFVAGEGGGKWEVQGPASDGSVRVYYAGPTRERPRGFVSFIASGVAEARAVAAVLNYLEAKGE